jgi:hypothetical protein
MASNTSLWRPRLFAATGVGFKDDPHLVDGQHFRWHIAHHLGLPFQSGDEKRGLFRLYHRRGGPNTIETFPLIGGAGGGSFPIHDEGVPSQESGLIVGADSLSFWKRPSLDLALLFLRLRGILDANPSSLWGWREAAEDLALRRYVAEVTARLGPDFVRNTILRERTDACAVDIGFSGIGPGAPSPLGRRFLVVDGLDRGGRVVDQDWVGHEPSGAPRTVARLRSAGFAAVRWTQVQGEPAVTRTQTSWVLSEDYCHSEGWVEAGEYRFVADPDFHTPSVAKDHYAPFHAPFDPDEVADAIGNLLLSTPEIKALFEPGQDVYGMVSRTASFQEAHDARAGAMQASLLQSLIASGVDPVMARVLGLYGFVAAADADERRGGDVLIEAELPFFEPANLEAIDGRLHALLPEQDPAFFRNAAESLRDRRLCALVLAPALAKRPPVPKPEGLATSVSVAALPAQGPTAETQLFVHVRLDVKVDPLEARPELTPVAYLVERQISGGAFENISETLGEPDILDKIGILPAVYFPARTDSTGEAPLRVADDFVMPDLQPGSVLYRITAFDVFGRPSDPTEGDLSAIDPPILPPPPPINPAARIVADAGNLVLEVDFAVNGATPPLEAEWQRLEMTIHRLPPLDPVTPDPRPAGEVTWTGQVAARRLAADVLPGNILHSALDQSCVELAWTPGLTSTDAPEAVCAPLYPPPAPQLIPVDPPSSSFAETGLRSYRLRLTVGPETGLPPSRYRWCARFVVVGRNPLNGTRLDSREACVAADWMVHPPPPEVVPPITSVVPLSSYPDVHGDSWYDLDLGAWGLAAGDRVNVYMTRLRRLGDDAEGLVVDGVLQDQVLFEQMARASRRPFELVTREPVQFAPAAPFHRIKVPGHLREVYVLAVLGANAYLQERRWADAGFTLFTTPDRRPEPRLSFLRLTRHSPAVAGLEFAADFTDLPGAATPPKVQLFRRDLSAGARLSYVGEATGTPVPVVPGSEAAIRFLFAVDDPGQADWHAYEYEAQLLHHDPGLGSYLRSRAVARALARGAWNGTSAPVTAADAIEVALGSPSGLVLGFEFDCGEFDFTLVRSLGGTVASRFAGRIREGRVFGLDPAIHTLDLVRRGGRLCYRLTLRDAEAVPAPVPAGPDEPRDGAYVLRIAFGEEVAWTVRENVVA